MNSGDIFERDGHKFVFTIEDDDNADLPWDNEDGHGPIKKVPSSIFVVSKRAGQRLVHSSNLTGYLYDFAEAVKIARRDGWGYDGKGVPEWQAEGLTLKQIARNAAERDFKRLADWFNDVWHYVGVIVTLCDDDGKTPRPLYQESLWGIESDAGEYLDETAHDLAGEILTRMGVLEPKGAGADDGRDFTPPYEP